MDQIFARIGGTSAPDRARAAAPPKGLDPATLLLLVVIFGVFGVAALSAMRSSMRRGYTVDRRGWRSYPPIIWGGGSGWGGSGGGGWGGGGGGGGFSGGGGSFGGGGASGDW